MRRSIFAAIMALFCLTSCVLDDGHTPNYDNSSKLIYDYATNTIYNKCTQNVAEVIYTDALLRGDSETADIVKELFFSKYTTTIEGNNILIIPSTDTYYYTTIKTDGKPLSEGGQWSVYINIERNPRLVCKGIVGENCAFRVQNEYSDYSDSKILDHTLRYAVTEDKSLAITVVGSGEINDVNNFKMQYQIDDQNPLVYKKDNVVYPANGTLSIDYLDKQTGFSKSVKGKASNYTVVFE